MKRAILLGAALATAATGVGAQAAPTAGGRPVSILLGVGAGATPAAGATSPGNHDPAVLASGGVRVRSGRTWFVDATVSRQAELAMGDDLTVPGYGTRYRRYALDQSRTDVLTLADVRGGVERRLGGALARVSAGGGYAWGLDQPFASALAGLGTGGRILRLTMDLELRVLRLPVHELMVSQGPTYDVSVVRHTHQAASAAMLRFGVEVPLRR